MKLKFQNCVIEGRHGDFTIYELHENEKGEIVKGRKWFPATIHQALHCAMELSVCSKDIKNLKTMKKCFMLMREEFKRLEEKINKKRRRRS